MLLLRIEALIRYLNESFLGYHHRLWPLLFLWGRLHNKHNLFMGNYVVGP